MDPFKILSVPETATLDEIKNAYRKLASKNHPDRGGDTKAFQEIQHAYDTLTDSEKRAKFDMARNFQNNRNYNPFQDLVNQFTRQTSQRIYTATVFVTLEQVATGSKENIQINNGYSPQLIQIDIPQGLEDGQQYRFNNIMPDGWLQIMFRIHSHPKFSRNGLDLFSEEEINVLKLITGTSIIIDDIFGNKIELSIPPMTKPNTKMKISQRGLKNSGRIGDHYVLINASLPDIISDKLLHSVKEELHNNNQ